MKKFLMIGPVLAAMMSPAWAQDASVFDRWTEDPTQVFDAADVTVEELKWVVRPLVVFAQSPLDPLFQQQMDLIAAGMDDLALRDVIVLTDTAPDARSALRQKLRPRAFSLTLLTKDGQVAFRKPAPWDVREISRSIDKMPLRRQEISDRRTVDN